MKTNILLAVAGLALGASAWGQTVPAPAPVQTPADAPAATPAVPAAAPVTNAVPAIVPPGTNAAPPAAVIAAPPAEPPLLSGANLSTNAAGTDSVRWGTNAEIVPLIVIDDVPLIDAVKNLARQTGLNYIPDPKLLALTNQPNVTLRLENVTAQDALMAVLETYNLQIVHDPRVKVSRLTVKDPKAEEPLYSKIIQLKYAQPTNVVEIITRSFSSPRFKVLGEPRTSQLIVVASEREFPAVEELIAKLDTPTRQVLIEAQLWESAKNPTSVKGIDWSGTLAAQNVTFGNGRLVNGVTETLTPGESKTVDIPGKGPSTVTPNSSTRSSYTYAAPTLAQSGAVMDTARGLHPATAFLNADGLRAVISFLNSDSDTEVVATPRAVTMDNQKAELSVTRAFPIFKVTPGSANSPAGAEITYTNLGTILSVLPHIAANSNISLSVIPEVSNIDRVDEQIVNGSRNTANIYAIRRMETHVMIPSGNTLVLGGLIYDKSQNQINKVPLLGDAPGIGYFFRKSSKSRDKSNLIVFITPTIVQDYDFQVASTDFLQTKSPERPEPKDSIWDSAKPYDWTKPEGRPPETKPLRAD